MTDRFELENQKFLTHSAAETTEIGFQIATKLLAKQAVGDKEKGATVLCLYGDLGSGKTTFTQGFAKGLGFQNRLPSPTFIIVRRYSLPHNEFFFYHIDLYRLHTMTEIEGIGIKEIFNQPRAFVVIEWAERLGELTPAHRVDSTFTQLGDNDHQMTLQFI